MRERERWIRQHKPNLTFDRRPNWFRGVEVWQDCHQRSRDRAGGFDSFACFPIGGLFPPAKIMCPKINLLTISFQNQIRIQNILMLFSSNFMFWFQVAWCLFSWYLRKKWSSHWTSCPWYRFSFYQMGRCFFSNFFHDCLTILGVFVKFQSYFLNQFMHKVSTGF